MKKGFLIYILAISLVFAGCNKKAEAVQEPAAEENVLEEVTETEEIVEESVTEEVSLENLVGESFAEEGSLDIPYYEDDGTYEFSYTFHVPQIKDESEAAESINAEIALVCDGSINQLKAMQEGIGMDVYEPDYRDISYETYLNGDVLSLLLMCESSYSDWITYNVFNYDYVNKKIVRNDDILAIKNLSDDDFIKYTRYTLGKEANKNIEMFSSTLDLSSVSDEDDITWRLQVVPSLISCFYDTISNEGISTKIPMFLDAEGDLSIIGEVSVPAGAGVYPTVVKLDTTLTGYDTDCYKDIAKEFDYAGFAKDCLNLYDVEGFSCPLNGADSSNDTYQRSYYFGFYDQDPSVFVYQDAEAPESINTGYAGKLEFLGVDENGIMFRYVLDSLDDKPLSDDQVLEGTFYMTTGANFDEETYEYHETATYKYIDGHDLFKSNGTPVVLTKSFG